MFTIANGIILKGENLVPNRENIVVDENIIEEIKRAVKLIGKLYDVENSEVSITLTNDEKIHKQSLQ